jgi:periplasmic protein TonB
MSGPGYYQQKTGSPTGFAVIVALHAAVFAALILIKGPGFLRPPNVPLVIQTIPVDPDPPPNPPPQTDRQVRTPRQESHIDTPPQIYPPPPTGGFTVDPGPPTPPTPPAPPAAHTQIASIVPPPPVRREPELIGSDLQPPYPAEEQRAEREGDVRVRVTIGLNGRVTAVERLSATSQAFFAATQRQALSRWRFRPATEDGRPVESSKVMIVHFRLEG